MARNGPGLARRAIDVAVSAFGLAVAGPILGMLMLAVRLTSSGPALYSQIRVGEGGRPFVIYKLRTMRVRSDGPNVTAADDPRVTRLGRVLRRTSLDELPQLWNVLRGDMTLVGPRPETPDLANRYPADCQWIFQFRPGLTGPAQVRLRDADVYVQSYRPGSLAGKLLAARRSMSRHTSACWCPLGWPPTHHS